MLTDLIKPMSEEYAVYLRDESRVTGSAEHIAFAQNERELAALLKHASATNMPVTLQGARTGLAAAAVPHGGLVINLMRMNKVAGMRKDKDGRFYIRVQPGVILSQLKKRIEDRRFDTAGWDEDSLSAYAAFRDAPEQFFSPDPTESSCTIGGMAACNASGARSYHYGAVRGHISALRLMLIDGDIISLKRGENFAHGRSLSLVTEGGHTLSIPLPAYTMPRTKNASGYYIKDDMDAIDLIIGSDGTLGVITEIELSLLPMTGVIWGVAAFFERESDAIDFVIAARESMSHVAALEYFDSRCLGLLREARAENPAFGGLPSIPPDRTCIYTELHCDNEQQAAERLFELGDIINKCGGDERDTWVSRTAFDRDKLIFFRHAAPECVNMIIDRRKKREPVITKLGTDMAVPNEHLKDVLDMYHSDLADLGAEYAIWGHIGDNHVHVNVLPRTADEHRATKALYLKWADKVSRLGGSVSAEHGVGKLKAEFLRVMYGDAAINEMAELKRLFDPEGLLGAGNLFSPERGERPCV